MSRVQPILSLLAAGKLQDAIALTDSTSNLTVKDLVWLVMSPGKDAHIVALATHFVSVKGIAPNDNALYTAALYKHTVLVDFLSAKARQLPTRFARAFLLAIKRHLRCFWSGQKCLCLSKLCLSKRES
jgi:hypothetical protein